MKAQRILLFTALSVIFYLSSCVSNKKYTLLQNENTGTVDTSEYMEYVREDYKVQINDIINIRLKTPDPKAAELFQNIGPAFMSGGGMAGGMAQGGLFFYLNGFRIHPDGFIDLPVVGEVMVEGKYLKEIKQDIEGRLQQYLKEVYIVVQISGINVSILGEVAAPGKYTLYQNQLSILEALSEARGPLVTAKRYKVSIVRQYSTGAQIHQVDLTDKNLIKSPYYFLQPNDIVYVEPLKVRELGTGINGFQTIANVLSVLSSTLLIIALLGQ